MSRCAVPTSWLLWAFAALTGCSDICADDEMEDVTRSRAIGWDQNSPLGTGRAALERVRATLQAGIKTKWASEAGCWSEPISDIVVEVDVRERMVSDRLPVSFERHTIVTCEGALDNGENLRLPIEVEVVAPEVGLEAVGIDMFLYVYDDGFTIHGDFSSASTNLTQAADLSGPELSIRIALKFDGGLSIVDPFVIRSDLAPAPSCERECQPIALDTASEPHPSRVVCSEQ